MMHSKVYIFKAGHKRTSVVGSSNLSHFALEGKNVEANTIVEGDKTEKIFKDQQSHFDKIWIRSSNLNHKLALYYDTFFKHCSEGFSIQEFKGSQFETDTSTAIQSILSIFNTTSIPSVRDTIVFLEPPTHFRTLAETYHLLHIGHDDFIVAKCFGGKRTSGAGSSTEEHKFKITYKKPSYELQTCGSIAIPSTIEFTTLEVVELVKSHEIISGNFKFSKKTFRSKTWIIDHLKLNPLDTILINPAKVREDKKLTENDLKLEKIIKICNYLELKNQTFDGFIDWILKLRKDLNMPHKLSDVIDEKDFDIERLSKMALEDPSTSGNPKKLTVDDMKLMYKHSMSGELF